VLAELPRFPAATHASTLQEQDSTPPCTKISAIACLLPLQDLFLVLPRFLAASHAITLQEQDTVQVCHAPNASLI
jgi:hypothetical protein